MRASELSGDDVGERIAVLVDQSARLAGTLIHLQHQVQLVSLSPGHVAYDRELPGRRESHIVLLTAIGQLDLDPDVEVERL